MGTTTDDFNTSRQNAARQNFTMGFKTMLICLSEILGENDNYLKIHDKYVVRILTLKYSIHGQAK